MFRFLLAFIRLMLCLTLVIIYLIILLLAFLVRINIKIRHKIVKQWAKLVCYILGFRISINKQPIPNGVLILPNHRSWIDVPLIFSIVPATIIAKREIRNWPVIGWGFTAIDAILVNRSKMGSLMTTFKEIRRKILDNRTVIIFPEGTICIGPETGTFKNGAFKVAADHNIRIVPIAFEFKDRKDVWAKGDVLLYHYFKTMGKRRTYIKVEIGDSINSNDENWLLNTTKKWLDEKILAMRNDFDNMSD